jgi:hypothetical protein
LILANERASAPVSNRRRLARALGILGLLLRVAGQPSDAAAVELAPGDAVVADPDARGVFVLDLVSGSATEISTGNALLYPSGVAALAPGEILVADPDANAIVQVDPSDGSQATLCAGAPLLYPTGVAVAPGGHLLVADPVANAIFELAPETCDATTRISGAPLLFPSGVRVEESGDILVADPDANAIFRFADGSPPELVTADDLLRSAQGVVPDVDDRLVVDPVVRGVIRETGGSQSIETEITTLPYPTDVEIVPVPEPGQLAQLTSGLFALGGLCQRRRMASRA